MIVVTGASRGIGRAICERLMSKNIPLLGISRRKENYQFPSIDCDVSSYENIKLVAQKLKKNGIALNGLINVAGIASMNLALTTPPSVTQDIIKTNLLGTIFCCQLFAPLIIKNKMGTIINFSTIAVPLGLKGESIYVASKSGVEGFTHSFSREMADFNINVNCISPGPIRTDLLNGITDIQIQKIISRQVITKQFNTESICDLVELLFDQRSRSLTGQVFNVGGV
jgi:3-oxoacyl-[acyl-carrier protein] reductase